MNPVHDGFSTLPLKKVCLLGQLNCWGVGVGGV